MYKDDAHRWFNSLGRLEFAGDIEAVGTAVTGFHTGDQVFGTAGTGFGAHAEYLCVGEAGVVASKPTTLTYEEAVAVCDGALTALVFLRDEAHLYFRRSVFP